MSVWRAGPGAMLSFPRRLRLLATSLSALAGFVDAIAFVSAGGFFVSMGGTSARMEAITWGRANGRDCGRQSPATFHRV